jgi:hypothetical protein
MNLFNLFIQFKVFRQLLFMLGKVYTKSIALEYLRPLLNTLVLHRVADDDDDFDDDDDDNNDNWNLKVEHS